MRFRGLKGSQTYHTSTLLWGNPSSERRPSAARPTRAWLPLSPQATQGIAGIGQAPSRRPSKALKRPQNVLRHEISGPRQTCWSVLLTLPESRRHAYAVCGPSQSEHKSEMNTRSGFTLSPPRGSPHLRHVDHGDDSEYDAEDDADLSQNFCNADESFAANRRSSSCSRSLLGLGAAYPCTDSILSGRRDHEHGRDHMLPDEKPAG